MLQHKRKRRGIDSFFYSFVRVCCFVSLNEVKYRKRRRGFPSVPLRKEVGFSRSSFEKEEAETTCRV